MKLVLLVTLGVATQPGQVDAAEAAVDFARDIRPLLSNACFHCHGPDDATRQADLRLDTREGLMSMVEAGDPSASELIRRIDAHDSSERMPPPEANKSLTAEQRKLFKEWVSAGAAWEQHWSFVKPERASVPSVEREDWCRNEIDRFILARLEAEGLAPSAAAPPATLVRRLFLDLIGLPPTRDEAQLWIGRIWPDLPQAASVAAETQASMDEAAYQELITYLLASPHYGERWARRWLDLARYADTNGYEKDRERSIWPYRDWVIQALNQDLPFDRFTIEQLAGDMLPQATRQQHVATGFHRNTMLNEEGGIDPLEFRFHAMTDRVATTGTTWLGLTLGCCQCHTHKYDPITHTEYYQLMAFLNNADEPSLELPGEDLQERWEQNRRRADELLRQLPQQWPVPAADAAPAAADAVDTSAPAAADGDELQRRAAALEAAFEKWLAAERQNAVAWQVLRPLTATANLPILTIESDQAIFASGDTAKRDDYDIDLAACDFPVTAIMLEALPDERLPERGPGSTYYEGTLGDFFLNEIRFHVGAQELQVASASESYAQNRYGSHPVSAALAVDQDVQTGWSVHGRQGERHVAVFELAEPLPAGQPLSIHMTFGRHFASSLGRFRFQATAASHPTQAREYAVDLQRSLARQGGELQPAELQQLREVFLMQAPELAKPAAEIRRLRARPAVDSTLVLSERPQQHQRPTYRHHRGEYLQPAEEVEPGLPEVLPGLPEAAPTNRLGFAQWLVSPENPLTARVVVNRHWQALFGTGIVKTVDDFGLQGEPPSHPALLDYLAWSFVHEDRWSLKKLHRRLVSSSVYRQTSALGDHVPPQDPNNRLLSRMTRFRLDAEILRDSMLVAAGTLSEQLGGPPVRPPQPAGVTEVAYGSPKWQASQGADRYRRSIYTFVKRTAPFAMFSTFDAPSGEACLAQRTRSNSPLQALTLLNDVMVMDLARAAGQRFAPKFGSDPATIRRGLSELFQAAVVREPTSGELNALADFLAAQATAFEHESAEAAALLGISAEQAEALSADELAYRSAWVASARTVFGLDEFQVRE